MRYLGHTFSAISLLTAVLCFSANVSARQGKINPEAGRAIHLNSDLTPPVNRTAASFINNGNRVTSSSAVYLYIRAIDTEANLSGYFLSESPEIPLPGANGWHQIQKTGEYSSRVIFMLGPGNGKKTIHVWFRDLYGNISESRSDTIQKYILKNLPDTGQHQRFTDIFFFGEDADYVTHPMKFIDYKDGTVKDTVTGLLWQNPIGSDPKTWKEAVEYCDSLVFGNNSLKNWRLPTVSELFSILDFGETSPSINSKYFPGTMPNFYWSSTQYASFAQMAWYVDFNFATTGYYRFKSNHYYVRCVCDGI